MAKKRRRFSNDDDSNESRSATNKKAKIISSSDDSSSWSDDDGRWNAKSNKEKTAPKKAPMKKKKKASSDNEQSDMEEFKDGLDENLMGDEEDRKLLSIMTEVEREQELFNRSEKREAIRTRFQIAKKLQAAMKKQKLQQQLESKQSKSEKKTADENGDGDAEVTTNSKRKRDDSDWDRDSDQEEDEDEENERFIFTRQHLNDIRLSRVNLAKLCFGSLFADTIIGCFVCIRVSNRTAGPRYQVGQVTGLVSTPRIYRLGKAHTNKALKLRIAKLENVYRMEYVSNEEVSQEEFDHWYAKMLDDKIRFPNKNFVERKKKEITDASCHNFSDLEVKMIVNEKDKFRSRPVNYAMKKIQLMREIDNAELDGDHDKVVQMAQQIEKIEKEANWVYGITTKNIAGISFINKRNRMKNIGIEDKDDLSSYMPTMTPRANKNKNADTVPNNVSLTSFP